MIADAGAGADRPARFLDSHCHLADPAFDPDRADVIERARAAGAVGVVCVGESLDRARAARSLALRFPGFIAWTAGIHPHDAATFEPARDVPLLGGLLADGACAVGECGLDGFYDNAPPADQRRAFAAQLGLALEHDKPVVVHTREAVADTAAMIREAGGAGVRGVLHCFTGPASLAEVALAAGWYISFSGIVTFRKWDGDGLVRMVPSDRLLVESDAPYLAPTPNRGKRNEPAWVGITAERVAGVRGVSAGLLGDQVVENAMRLFDLPALPA